MDTYDPVLRKYMTSFERGITKPKKSRNGNYTLAPKQNTYLKGTNGIFRPSDSQHKLLRPATPLNDRTNTPRRA